MSIFIAAWLYFSVGTLLCKLVTISGIGAVFAVVTYLICIFNSYDIFDDDDEWTKKSASFRPWAVRLTSIWIAAMIISSFVPNESRLLKIIGVGTAYHITQTDEAKKIPDNVLKAVNTFLENVNKLNEDEPTKGE